MTITTHRNSIESLSCYAGNTVPLDRMDRCWASLPRGRCTTKAWPSSRSSTGESPSFNPRSFLFIPYIPYIPYMVSIIFCLCSSTIFVHFCSFFVLVFIFHKILWFSPSGSPKWITRWGWCRRFCATKTSWRTRTPVTFWKARYAICCSTAVTLSTGDDISTAMCDDVSTVMCDDVSTVMCFCWTHFSFIPRVIFLTSARFCDIATHIHLPSSPIISHHLPSSPPSACSSIRFSKCDYNVDIGAVAPSVISFAWTHR